MERRQWDRGGSSRGLPVPCQCGERGSGGTRPRLCQAGIGSGGRGTCAGQGSLWQVGTPGKQTSGCSCSFPSWGKFTQLCPSQDPAGPSWAPSPPLPSASPIWLAQLDPSPPFSRILLLLLLPRLSFSSSETFAGSTEGKSWTESGSSTDLKYLG